MNRLILALALLFGMASVGLKASRPLLAAPVNFEATGTVIGFDQDNNTLSVNTRLGPEVFRVSSTTTILLNNHGATLQDIQQNDQVTVTFRFDTNEASTVHLFREVRRTGKITSVTNTAIGFRVGSAQLQLRPNEQSRVTLLGIPVTDRSVLTNLPATAVYEPGSLLVLSLGASATGVTGRIKSVDATRRRITLAGRRPTIYAVAANATLLRSGRTAELSEFQVGDRVRFARIGRGATNRIAALTTIR